MSFVATTCLPFLAIALHLVTGGYVYKTDYFTVPVDHFSFTNNDTFRMKYLINDSFWDPKNGPIFFYAGNEGSIETFCENTGFMWEIAPEFRAMLVFAEHRYYGESMPYGNGSFDDKGRLGYLTSQQALADYVDLITYLKRRRQRDDGTAAAARDHQHRHRHRGQTHRGADGGGGARPEAATDRGNRSSGSNPAIVFGGSYGGMLAAWFRLKYPAVVEGAIASSAPIWQFTGMTPCSEFAKVTSLAYSSTSAECALTISASWQAIDNVTKTAEGKSWLSEQWKLCSPLAADSDVIILKNWLAEIYVDLAMINYPYPANFLTPLPGYPIKEFCKPLKNHTEDNETLLISLFKGVNLFFNYTGTSKCLDYNNSATPTLGTQGWNYQSCTEMVMPMCSNGVTDMFEVKPWNFEENAKYCFEVFGVRPQIDIVEKIYGGKNLNAASNIIFSNGLLDPWSSGGVMHNISKTVQAVIIPESAHHLDLRASNSQDPESVIKARQYYKNWIKKWTTHYQKQSTRDSVATHLEKPLIQLTI